MAPRSILDRAKTARNSIGENAAKLSNPFPKKNQSPSKNVLMVIKVEHNVMHSLSSAYETIKA